MQVVDGSLEVWLPPIKQSIYPSTSLTISVPKIQTEVADVLFQKIKRTLLVLAHPLIVTGHIYNNQPSTQQPFPSSIEILCSFLSSMWYSVWHQMAKYITKSSKICATYTQDAATCIHSSDLAKTVNPSLMCFSSNTGLSALLYRLVANG